MDLLAPGGPVAEQAAAAGIRVERDGRRLTVTLARPDRRNAMTPATWRALAAVGDAVPGSDVSVVVLRAEGPSFSAGLDRGMFGEGTDGEPGLARLAALPPAEIDAAIAGFQRGFSWWREVDAVSIAAVGGHAVGGGFQLALACDLRVLADDAALAMREPSLGIVPDLGGTSPLVRTVGYSRALEICATGRWVGAQEAAALGLAEVVVARAELDAAVDDLAGALLAAPQGALAATKHLLAGALDRSPVDQRAAERAAQVPLLRRQLGGHLGRHPDGS